jgi:hypothetical protein
LEILAGYGTNQFISATLGTDFPQLLRIVAGLLFPEHGGSLTFRRPEPTSALDANCARGFACAHTAQGSNDGWTPQYFSIVYSFK